MRAILDFQSECFSYFWSTRHLNTSNEVLSQLTFWLRRKSKQIFNMAAMVVIFDFRLE